ncbi:hypothetical protein [Rhodopirellula baltica]|uniref:hypothetical protein n=1 Tax=Rhodopirellula baltica TaxID=265606 RepID=UPI001F425EAB|nr:hypothetical protein [Rhodopirellula baltica]
MPRKFIRFRVRVIERDITIDVVMKALMGEIIATVGRAPLRIVPPSMGKIVARPVVATVRPIECAAFNDRFPRAVASRDDGTPRTTKHKVTEHQARPCTLGNTDWIVIVRRLADREDFVKERMVLSFAANLKPKSFVKATKVAV